MFDARCPILVKLRLDGRVRPVAMLKVPVPTKGLWGGLDGAAKASVANDIHEGLVRGAPRLCAAPERQDTAAAWEIWNEAVSEVWSGACG
eukprot:12016161-Alexandrium_andersonii.AAC.1